jgi:protein gp37
MLKANQHIFQVLTKRPARMLTWTQARFSTLPSHIWLGTSVENDLFKGRIRQLQQTPATVRFLSLEPLIGRIHLDKSFLDGIHWVIVGGESGFGARPMKAEWVHSIHEQCLINDVAFFFKQWGAHTPDGRRVGKKAAGRELDGHTWDQMPALANT